MIAGWHRLRAIEYVLKGKTLSEAAEEIRRNPRLYAATSQSENDWILGRRQLWLRLSRSVSQQPCLYMTLLQYAFLTSKNECVELNVCVSVDRRELGQGGHCWITRNGDLVHELPGDGVPRGELIAEKDGLRFWVREAIRVPRRS